MVVIIYRIQIETTQKQYIMSARLITKTTKKTIATRYLLTVLWAIIGVNTYAQVTIGMGEAPSKTALLQLKTQEADLDNVTSKKGGLLLPRVKLVSLTTLQPFIEPTDTNYTAEKRASTGLLVYNIYESPTGDIKPGVYSWNGTKWEESSSDGSSAPSTPANAGAVKLNMFQSNYITLSGNQSYGLLMQNQGVTINPTYATGLYPGGTTSGSPLSIITSIVGNNGNDEALLLEAPESGKANFYRMNMEFVMGNSPPSQTRIFDVSVISAGSGIRVYQNSVVVPGGLNTGHTAYFQIFFATIADAASLGVGYRIMFGVDTAGSTGLPNNIRVKILDITRISQ